MNHDPPFAASPLNPAAAAQPTRFESAASPTPSGEAGATAAGAAADSGPVPSPETAPAHLDLPPIQPNLSFQTRCRDLIAAGQEAFAQTGSWVVFYRELLGHEGRMRKLFRDTDELHRFEETPEFADLLEMAAALRSQDMDKVDAFEPQKMITVRLPKSQHETLKQEAQEHGTSINKLCISKLLLPIAGRFVPLERGKVRGRKPGPQGKRNERMGR